MRCHSELNIGGSLRVLQHKYQSQQSWIDRAEEDLLCAVFLCRQRINYSPLANICYLLHQSIEKWLKRVFNNSPQRLVLSLSK